MSISHDIVDEARAWLGVPFRHQGRAREGVDCLGLLVRVAFALQLRGKQGDLLASRDQLAYGHYPDEVELRTGLERCLLPVAAADRAAIGLFNIDGSARHLAIFGANNTSLTLIHAYAPARKVVEHRFDGCWRDKLVALYEVPIV